MYFAHQRCTSASRSNRVQIIGNVYYSYWQRCLVNGISLRFDSLQPCFVESCWSSWEICLSRVKLRGSTPCRCILVAYTCRTDSDEWLMTWTNALIPYCYVLSMNVGQVGKDVELGWMFLVRVPVDQFCSYWGFTLYSGLRVIHQRCISASRSNRVQIIGNVY